MYKRILSPIDGSAPSDRGLLESIRLAQALQAELRLLHVVDLHPLLPDDNGGIPIHPDLAELFRHAGAQLLHRAVRTSREHGVPAHAVMHEVSDMRVAERIVQEAASWPAEIVVMGTHGRRGVGGVLLGSTAETVARLSAVPVLLVPAL